MRKVCAGTNTPIERRRRFNVVIENIGMRVEHDLEGALLTLEVGCQHFDCGLRRCLADRGNRQREVRCATVGKVVPVNGGI